MSMAGAKELTDDDIRLCIHNCSGMRSTLLPSDEVVSTLLKEQIVQFEEPALKCVELIYDELDKIVKDSSSVVERFPVLRQRFVNTSLDLLNKFREPTKQQVQTIIRAEVGHINFENPTFSKAYEEIFAKVPNDNVVDKIFAEVQNYSVVDKIAENVPAYVISKLAGNILGNCAKYLASKVAEGGESTSHMTAVPNNIHKLTYMSPQDAVLITQVRGLVDAYLTICRNNICDMVPKIIVLLMINQLCAELFVKLIGELHSQDEDKSTELLSEDKNIEEQREATISMMKCIKKAQAVLSKVEDNRS